MRAALRKKTSTKAERIFAEILKRNHIPFEHRKMIEGHEIDFVIGKYAIEIDGHPQSSMRNQMLFRLGYVPLHYGNRALREEPEFVEASIIQKVKKYYE